MKNLKFLPLLLPLIFLNAQGLDESYLESLPEDIREDLLERSKEKSEGSEENYRSSLYSSKLEQTEELLELKSRLEADLEELERRLKSDESLSIKEELKLFGSDFFDTFQTSFMPINEPNPDSSYTLDTGDVLNIQLIGQEDINDVFPIGGDGSISMPDVGKLTLAGLTLKEAVSLIKSKVANIYIGTDAFVSLDQIRDVNILISGNAKNPGVYTLTGNSNILHAITVAGGINDFGSYREINLLRNGEIIETLDVYNLLIEGKYNLKKRLRSGDVIFVEARKNVVSIDGAVKRPAKYELKDGEFLDSVIKFSNGIKHSIPGIDIFIDPLCIKISCSILSTLASRFIIISLFLKHGRNCLFKLTILSLICRLAGIFTSDRADRISCIKLISQFISFWDSSSL